MIIERVCVGALEANCYVIAEPGSNEAIIIDPGAEYHKIKNALSKHKLKPAIIINTHGHADHIGCDDEFGLPVHIHKDDVVLLRDAEKNFSSFLSHSFTIKAEAKEIKDGDIIELGQIKLEVLHTPGHTPGGISLFLKYAQEHILFSGDTLFFHSVGRTDFPGASHKELIRSIKEKLLRLPDATIVYPGHGPSTIIRAEKENNPFLE
ncbi:MAG: MBL fold metallo-hydrolase [Candidatus Omnitrophica bacterium]|nr:MBL fold metallo-hydrolase [Candidatus Omnitrophota bacterium]